MSNDSKHPSQDGDAAKEVKQTGVKSTEAPQAQSEGIPNDADELRALVRLLIAKERKVLVEDAATEAARISRQKQRSATATNNFHKRNTKQGRCVHEKGGVHRNKKISDPSVYIHRYIDGTLVIKCQGCNFAWKEGDTKRYITRFGIKQPNVTGKSWVDALEMLSRSTNTMSATEIPMKPAELPVIPLPGSEAGEEGADE
jgi:hypothetical protein